MNKSYLNAILILILIPNLLIGCQLGRLTPIGTPDSTGTDSGPIAVAYNPDATFLAVANQNSSTISVFSVDDFGITTEISGSPYSSGLSPVALSYSRDGKCLYVVNQGENSLYVYLVNTNGTLTQTAAYNVGVGANNLTYSFVNDFVAVTNGIDNTLSVFKKDKDVCSLSFIGNFSVGNSPTSVSYSADGTTLAVTNSSDNKVSIFIVNVNGSLTLLNTYTTGLNPIDCMFSYDGTALAVANSGSNSISIFQVNLDSTLTLLNTYDSNGTGLNSIEFSIDSSMLLATNSNALVVFNVNNMNALSVAYSVSSASDMVGGTFSLSRNFISVALPASDAIQSYNITVSPLLVVYVEDDNGDKVLSKEAVIGSTVNIYARVLRGTAPFTYVWRYFHIDQNNFVTEEIVQPGVEGYENILPLTVNNTTQVSASITDALGCTSSVSLPISITAIPASLRTGSAISQTISNKYCQSNQ